MLSKKIIKYIQSLSHKKLRDEQGVFIAEGPKVVAELLSYQNVSCKIICAEKGWIHEHLGLLNNNATEIYETDVELLKRISLLKTPNKVVAVFNKKDVDLNLQPADKLTLMLDDISDPGNLGTIIRTADWFGIENIICSENCVDCYNPKVVQSTMGSLARVNLFYKNLSSMIALYSDINVYAATLSGISITKFKNLHEGFILIGNESKGISKNLLGLSTNQITIPRLGNAESLNAAVATGIILSYIRSTPSS